MSTYRLKRAQAALTSLSTLLCHGYFPPCYKLIFFFFFFLSSAWKPADMWNIKGIPAGGMKAGGQLLIWLGVKRGGWNGNGREPRVSILDWATDSLCDWGSEYQKCFSVRLAVALDEGRDRDNPLSNSSYTITQPNFFFFGIQIFPVRLQPLICFFKN